MPKRQSAGILLHRRRGGTLEVLLVHPGGPFWSGKDAGAWSIPKGEFEPGEDPRAVALREFQEEIGQPLAAELVPLAPRKQPSGKLVHAYAAQGDLDAADVRSNLFTMEWPPRSGKQQEFPEVDRAQWFTLSEAGEKILAGQRGFLDELSALLQRTEKNDA